MSQTTLGLQYTREVLNNTKVNNEGLLQIDALSLFAGVLVSKVNSIGLRNTTEELNNTIIIWEERCNSKTINNASLTRRNTFSIKIQLPLPIHYYYSI